MFIKPRILEFLRACMHSLTTSHQLLIRLSMEVCMVLKDTPNNTIIIILQIIMVRLPQVEVHLIGSNLLLGKPLTTVKAIRTASILLKLAALKIQVSLILRFSLLNRIYHPKLKVKSPIPNGVSQLQYVRLNNSDRHICLGLSNIRHLIYRIINLILKVTNLIPL